jgi:hypothetical protein
MMDRDAHEGFEREARLQGFGGTDMRGAHHPARLIGTDRNERQVHGSEPPTNLPEVRPARRIAREIDHARVGFDHKASPKACITVEKPPGREVPRRNIGRANIVADAARGPPVEFNQAGGGRRATNLQAGDHQRRIASSEPPQRRTVAMVVVIVAQQHDVDLRQGFEREGWGRGALHA